VTRTFIHNFDPASPARGPIVDLEISEIEDAGIREALQLTQALEEAGIARDTTYIANVVKHLKFVRRGKRCIHEKTTTGEVKHYRWWLEKELEFVHPRHVVAWAHGCLGIGWQIVADR
jgi:hypothetical protein